MSLPNCPKCNSEYVYEDGILLVCPECAYEWDPNEVAEEEGLVVLDSNGTRLADGDIKQGTRVKNIRLVEGDHNIDCKIDGFGAMKLKSEFVKKI